MYCPRCRQDVYGMTVVEGGSMGWLKRWVRSFTKCTCCGNVIYGSKEKTIIDLRKRAIQ